MPRIYRYEPFVIPGPFGTTITHRNTEDAQISLMGTVGGYHYISVPDEAELPEQPREIALEQVELDGQTREALRRQMSIFQVTRRLADSKIRQDVGDTSDLIADLAKRIGLVERMIMRLSFHLLQNEPVPAEIKDAYLPIVQSYLQAIDVLELRDRVDLESNVRLASVLIQRFSTIAEIVDDLHVQRVRELLGDA